MGYTSVRIFAILKDSHFLIYGGDSTIPYKQKQKQNVIEDEQINGKLHNYIEDFHNFQSSHDYRLQKQKKTPIFKWKEVISKDMISQMDKSTLIHYIFKTNYYLVDKFFRKEYLEDLKLKTKEELEKIITKSLDIEPVLLI